MTAAAGGRSAATPPSRDQGPGPTAPFPTATPRLHYSTTPPLHCSTTPLLHHSASGRAPPTTGRPGTRDQGLPGPVHGRWGPTCGGGITSVNSRDGSCPPRRWAPRNPGRPQPVADGMAGGSAPVGVLKDRTPRKGAASGSLTSPVRQRWRETEARQGSCDLPLRAERCEIADSPAAWWRPVATPPGRSVVSLPSGDQGPETRDWDLRQAAAVPREQAPLHPHRCLRAVPASSARWRGVA